MLEHTYTDSSGNKCYYNAQERMYYIFRTDGRQGMINPNYLAPIERLKTEFVRAMRSDWDRRLEAEEQIATNGAKADYLQGRETPWDAVY